MTPQGQRVAHAFAAELRPVAEQLRGNTVLQLGGCGENLWLKRLKFGEQWIVNPCPLLKKTSVQSSLLTLPMDRDSVDCVIAPLTLEAFSREKHPIDEIDRVLKPMGYAIFFGINPFSFWGLALRLRRIDCFGTARVSLFSSMHVKHMMLLRGYRLCALTSFYYIPPFSSEYLIQKLEFFNEMGKMIWPFPAGFYCFIAQKYQHCAPSLTRMALKDELLLQEKASLQPTALSHFSSTEVYSNLMFDDQEIENVDARKNQNHL
ncbi:MAG: methyltransferase domain-containing protein [Legionellales bacterium]|nr:methyltransferase domain-containing protein [Legionellales bacterium]